MINKPTKNGTAVIRRNALAVALAVGLGLSGGAAFAQSTQGKIFGNAAAGETVTVTSTTGLTRSVQVNADGTYTTSNLPTGTYTVTLMKDGAEAGKHVVSVNPGAGTQVNFAGQQEAQELSAISVSASALPPIDVSQPAASYVVTSEQLQQLPLGRDVDAIALLAPGVVTASGYFGEALTFAGAGATENAYYVNGFNTTALYNYTGPSVQLPYGSIATQETITGGYGAKYGRADGGVISQVGKRGTNEWHFGGQITWKPRSLMSDPDNIYYPQVDLEGTEELSDPSKQPGDLYQYRRDNKGWVTSKSVYVGGPLVQDRLFAFLSVQNDENKSTTVGNADSGVVNYTKWHSTNWYGKIDWNISDNNILEYTKLKTDEKNGYGQTYSYVDGSAAAYQNDQPFGKYSIDTDILHYTGYLTDRATLSVLYGRSDVKNPIVVPGLSDDPYISGRGSINPDLLPSNVMYDQTETQVGAPNSSTGSRALRVDLEYQLGDHLLQAGIDNLDYTAEGQGAAMTGPGYLWIYYAGDPDKPINETLGVGAPGGDGYYVRQYIYETVTSMSASQKAWYIQDKWQVTPNLMLQLGIRNDKFTNSNADGDAFVIEENQWEPRLAASWDVFGDSSLKVYGSLGRYYLALPQATGERAAGGSVYKYRYYTYTGVNEDGTPTGLTLVPTTGDPDGDGYVSANNEFGQAKDPETVTSQNLKPQYQDELIVGFDKTLGDKWVYGGKATYRTLGTVIDDMCDPRVTAAAIDNAGYDHNNYEYQGCFIMNPNQTNMYKFHGLDGHDDITVPASQALHNFPDVQRDYYAFDFYLTHPFDGTWYGKVSYTFARSWGNAEGQVRSDIGQTDVSVTEDWDYWELMDHARGYLANMRRHQLKAFGVWQFAPDWQLSGNLLVQSGMPKNCLGYFGPDKTNPGGGYGPDYHWCRGEPSPPGRDFNPWTYRLDMGVQYAPSYLKGFKVGLDVFNVTDSQGTLQTIANRMSSPNRVSNTYGRTRFLQDPRTVRLSVSYDY